jgi:hypothetical protein
MSKLIIPVLFIACCIYYGCNEDYPPPIIIEPIVNEPISTEDSCNGFNLVACSFHFREGKWVGILDSLRAQHFIADTIWFKEDSLIGWTDQTGDFTFFVGYFSQNLLYKQPWGSEPDDPVYPSGFWTQYDIYTELFRIYWDGGNEYRDYKRVD